MSAHLTKPIKQTPAVKEAISAEISQHHMNHIRIGGYVALDNFRKIPDGIKKCYDSLKADSIEAKDRRYIIVEKKKEPDLIWCEKEKSFIEKDEQIRREREDRRKQKRNLLHRLFKESKDENGEKVRSKMDDLKAKLLLKRKKRRV